METEVDVPNPDLVLIPGMFAEAILTLADHRDALSIPISAVSDMEKQPWVMVVNEDSMLERREVSLGLESASDVEILKGLKENDAVVVGNRSQLKPGEKVAPKTVELASLGGER
jgi:multidrug efflux pump subunit AcrA (membrane-fusion protein)